MRRRQLLWSAGLMGAAGVLGGLTGCSTGPAGTEGTGGGPLSYPSWMWQEAGVGDYWKATVDAFSKAHNGVSVTTRQIASNGYADRITTDIAAGNFPDILPVFTNDMFALLDNELLDPLDDRLARTSWHDKELPLAKVSHIDGKTYGAVVTASPQALVVNKKLIGEAGVAVPTTVPELLAAAKQVKARTGQWGFAFPMSSADVQNCYVTSMQWVLGHGSDWANAAGHATAADPATIEAVSRMRELVASGVVPVGQSTSDARTLFKDGKVAFMIDGPFLLSFVKAKNAALYPQCDFVASPTPTHAAITGGALWVMLNKARNKDLAWEYIDMVNQQEWQSRWIDVTAQLPGQTTAPSEQAVREGPWIKNMVDIAAKYQTGFGYAPPNRQIAGFASEWQKQVMDDLIPIWNGDRPVEAGLTALQTKLESWLKNKRIG